MKKLIFAAALLLTGSLTLTSCFRKTYDAPPDTSAYDPQIPVTHTIAQFKTLNGLYNPSTGGDTTLITDDIVISGIVVANDRSGNLYKQIVIQDSTGGLFININAYSLYSSYPVGRRIYVQCKGLYLGYNGGVAELGSSLTEQLSVNGLGGAEISGHIIKGAVGNPVKDTIVSLSEVKSITAVSANRSLIGRLITISDVQFNDTNVTYTDPAATTNRSVTDCLGSTASIAVRTSNYADFHAYRIAKGHGSITGIYTVYQTATTFTPQLVIRDTADVKMYGERCGSLVPTPVISIDSLRRMHPGSGTFTLPAVKVTGTVISDITKGNVSSGNFILEDGSQKGIILYLNSASYNLGDSLIIDATGGKLQLYNGAMELTGLTSSKISKPKTGRTVVPIQLSIAQLNASFSSYESVLVKIINATVTGGGTYSGNKTLSDGTGSVRLYTAQGATFSANNVPTAPKTFVGIGTLYTPNEIKLRDPAIDVY